MGSVWDTFHLRGLCDIQVKMSSRELKLQSWSAQSALVRDRELGAGS